MRRISSVCVWLLVVGGPLYAQPAPDLREFSETLEALSDQVRPAVVQIFSSGYAVGRGVVSSSNDLLSREQGSGSGVIVDAQGYVVTNAHVVANASHVEVELPLSAEDADSLQSVLRPRGRVVDAHVVGIDTETDLAVLRLQVDGELSALGFGDSEALRPGQLVMAFGSPLGLSNTVSLGVVSAIARQIRPDDPVVYVQTDASINPGNSGGPLINADGQIVGINTFILSQSGGSEGIGFAVPSNIVRTVYQQIRQFGRVRRGEIGVYAQTITPEMARGLEPSREWGVILGDVLPGGPADSAGMRAGDIVVTLDGKAMENARQFQVNLYPRQVGETVDIDVLRGDTRRTYTVTLIERPGDPSRFQEMVRPAEHLVPKLGILALSVTPQVAGLLPPLRQPRGVVVAVSSVPGATMRRELLLPGDVIHEINGRPVGSMVGLRTYLEPLRSGDSAVLRVERSGRLLYVTVRLQ